MGQGCKPVIHKRNIKNGQDLYKVVLSLTLMEEIHIHWVSSYTAGENMGVSTAT